MTAQLLDFAAARAAKPLPAPAAIRPARRADIVALPAPQVQGELIRVNLINAAGRLAPALIRTPASAGGVHAAIAQAVWL